MQFVKKISKELDEICVYSRQIVISIITSKC